MSGVLKAKLEWDQQEQERRLIELQRFEAGQSFNYEPHHYPWCTAYTPYDNTLAGAIEEALSVGNRKLARELAMKSHERGNKLIKQAEAGYDAALQELAENGRATMNPVNGEIMQTYALCARMNPGGQCPMFEPKISN
jgi:hypothetical protein